jgi:ABC-2 type transport system ATP-binding protein
LANRANNDEGLRMIEVRGLTRAYGDLKAVDDVSFSIARGEVVGLLGHNGAGKTTIMKMLTGYLEPSGGSIRIDNLDIADRRREVQQRIGYLPENCPLYPEMTVIDYLEYQGALHGVATEGLSYAVRTAIQRTALEPRAADEVATLSRGYRQRVGVAQAILHRPAILILDEPTNGLDPAQIQQMRTLIRELAESATVILSTHILQEVEAVCDRVLILRAGRLALDTGMDALGGSSRLLVTIDRAPTEATPVLRRLEPVKAVAPQDPSGPLYRYTLDTADPSAAAPLVARAVGEAGWSLHGLQPEIKDLETLFAEVNEVTEVGHA